jgi:hypothetical protein
MTLMKSDERLFVDLTTDDTDLQSQNGSVELF